MVIAPGTYNTLTIEYSLHDNITNVSGIITKTYNNIILTAGKNKRVASDLQVPDYSPWFDKFYMWDAIHPYWYGKTLPSVLISFGDYSSYGLPTESDGTGRWHSTINKGPGVIHTASNSCKNAPNVNEMQYYVYYGKPYYDEKTLWAFRGHLYRVGLWIKKQAVIYNDLKAAGYSQLISQSAMKERFYSSASDVTGIDYRIALYNPIRNTPIRSKPTFTNDYIYLPALGEIAFGKFYYLGQRGYYWSQNGHINLACFLEYIHDDIFVGYNNRNEAGISHTFE